MKHPPDDSSQEESLPDVHLNDLEAAWPIYQKWVATGRRFLPSQLMAEPTALFDDVLTIDSVAWSMEHPEDGQ